MIALGFEAQTAGVAWLEQTDSEKYPELLHPDWEAGLVTPDPPSQVLHLLGQ